jgi:hypothetical protein
MNASALWLVLLVAAALVEFVARRRPNRVSTLHRATSMAAELLPARVVLIAFWMFVGVHLFARYTIPYR